MTERTRRRLAWTIWIVGVVVIVGAMTFRFTLHEPFHPSDLSEPLAFASIGVVGLIVALHQPRNPIGWIYLVVWIGAAGIFAMLQEYAYWVETSHPTAPGEPIAVWLGNWTWVPIFSLLLTYPFLLFPDGHLPSSRWRPVAWGIAITSVLWSASFALNGGSDYTNAQNEHVRNPFAPASLVATADVVRIVLSFVMIGFMAATVASLVIRYRRSRADEREQIRWLMLAGGVTVFWFLLPLNHGTGGWADFFQGLVLTLIPIAIGIAILKYRLYDVDLVIRKTVVLGDPRSVHHRGIRRDRRGARVIVHRHAPPADRGNGAGRGRVPAGARLGESRSRTGSCSAIGRPRTRCSPASESASARPTPVTTSSHGSRAWSPRGPARVARRSGSGWATA